MKKLFFIPALALLVGAASCQKETVLTADSENGIEFKTALGQQTTTRASEFTGWANGDGLTVYSYPVESTTLYNQFELTLTDGAWGYGDTPVEYKGFPLRYYSWYPETNVTNTGVTTGGYVIGYTVPAVASQEDLVGAGVTVSGNMVTLPFKHLLSEVNFALMGSFGVGIEVTDIMVNDVASAGTYTFGASTPWSAQTGSADYAYTPFVDTTTDPDTPSNVIDIEGTGISYMGNGNGTYNRTNALMLMPQTFAAGSTGNISLNYSLTHTDEGGDPATETGSVTANLSEFGNYIWEPGKRYVYMIDFTSFLAGGEITFTVTVDDWTDAAPVVETLMVTQATTVHIDDAIMHHAALNAATTALTVFPIDIVGTITTLDSLAAIDGFEESDVIRIKCLTEGEADLLEAAAATTGWTVTQSGRVIILTKPAEEVPEP
ncbi:MAG: fimbrillin family protein [Alistipes sp.]|jgi:hypothetical protein|nr:fimbrillin family protein [Alistipes sp.]